MWGTVETHGDLDKLADVMLAACRERSSGPARVWGIATRRENVAGEEWWLWDTYASMSDRDFTLANLSRSLPERTYVKIDVADALARERARHPFTAQHILTWDMARDMAASAGRNWDTMEPRTQDRLKRLAEQALDVLEND